MKNRLSRIVTRTGDDGTTGLADGTRRPKDDARIAVLGSVDELNSQLGVLLAESLPEDIRAALLHIQNHLFDLGGALALPAQDSFAAARLDWLDEQIAHYNADLPPLREFILPGGSRAGAQCHVARSVTRRTERDLCALARHESPPAAAQAYLNRLSDLLFVLGRCLNRQHGTAESLWQKGD
ncbi:MAG: cob(I)yrinic acid a,c-diamide adenosyltransferase [Gallionella sp.]|nr:cob(I)yrinic acid a,c-diamide adenosyltransferase [Gallionella sp.]